MAPFLFLPMRRPQTAGASEKYFSYAMYVQFIALDP